MFKNIFFMCTVVVFFTETYVFSMFCAPGMHGTRALTAETSCTSVTALTESPVGASKFDELSDKTVETLLHAFGDFNITIPVQAQACDGKAAASEARTHADGHKAMTISMDEKIMSNASYCRWICYQRAAEALLHQEGKTVFHEAYLHACKKLLARGTTEDMQAILTGISRAFNYLFNNNDERVLRMIFKYLTAAACNISYVFERSDDDRLHYVITINKMRSGVYTCGFSQQCEASTREDLLKRVDAFREKARQNFPLTLIIDE